MRFHDYENPFIIWKMTERSDCFLTSEKSLMSDTFETSDETTLSLPSLSLSSKPVVSAVVGVVDDANDATKGKLLSIKDTERELNELKKENFNLKLRIYCLERNSNQINANSTLNFDFNVLLKELETKDQKIQTLERIISENKEFCEELEKKIEELEEKRKVLENETKFESKETQNALTMQLMSHLFEFCQLFRSSDDIDDTRRQQRVCRLLDASEDLLNCASILVTKSPARWPHSPSANKEGNPQSRDLDSESDDFWSEPDRNASRARIGLSFDDRTTDVTTPCRQRRRRRLQSVGERRLVVCCRRVSSLRYRL